KNPYVLPKEKAAEIEERMRQNVVSNDPEETKAEDQNQSFSSEKIKVSKVLPKALTKAIDNLPFSKIMQQKATKFVCLLFQKGLTEYKDLSVFVPLPVKYLEEVFNKGYHKDFFNKLKSSGIVECNEIYKQGSLTAPGFSKGYRINQSLLEDDFETVYYFEKKDDNSEDIIPINRTFLSKAVKFVGISDRSYLSNPCESSILTPSSSSSSLYNPLSSSPFMHISTRFFQRSLIFGDLSGLVYDQDHIWKKTEEMVLYISTRLFLTDEQISKNYFEVRNKITGYTYHTTRMKVLEWCKKNGVTLIQDGRTFYIDDLDRFIHQKKRNLLLNYKANMAMLLNKQFYANRNKTNNRLDHNLTSLNKVILSVI